MVTLWTLHRVGCHRLRCRVMCKVMCERGTTAGIPSASLLALPRQFLLLKTWLPLHGSVLVAEVQGQSLRVAACDGETALSNTVSLLMFAETSACLVRSLIRVLVCALVSPHVLGVLFRSWKVVRHCHMHTPSFLQLRSAGSYPHSHSF